MRCAEVGEHNGVPMSRHVTHKLNARLRRATGRRFGVVGNQRNRRSGEVSWVGRDRLNRAVLDSGVANLLLPTVRLGASTERATVFGPDRIEQISRSCPVADANDSSTRPAPCQSFREFRLMNRPGSDGGSQSMEDESYGSTEEVRRRTA